MKFRIDLLLKLRRIPPQERWLLVQAWVALLVVDVALRCLPFKTVLGFCQRVRVDRVAPTGATLSAARLPWLVEVASRHALVKTTCLTEALALSWLMSRKGLAATLRVGVARRDGGLIAHAWLEQGGQIILGNAGTTGYTPLLPFRQPYGNSP